MNDLQVDKLKAWIAELDHRLIDLIFDKYSEQQQHYHTLEHIYDMILLAKFFDLGKPMTKLNTWPTVLAMILFHDIVYDPTAPKGQNEEQSAVMVRLMLESYPGLDLDLVCEGIIATTNHQHDLPMITDFLNLDMSIMGSNKYVDYSTNIRKEYMHIPLDQYVIGRSAFLNSVLEKTPFIVNHSNDTVHGYFINTPWRWYFINTPWRYNILTELACLKSDPSSYFGE